MGNAQSPAKKYVEALCSSHGVSSQGELYFSTQLKKTLDAKVIAAEAAVLNAVPDSLEKVRELKREIKTGILNFTRSVKGGHGEILFSVQQLFWAIDAKFKELQ